MRARPKPKPTTNEWLRMSWHARAAYLHRLALEHQRDIDPAETRDDARALQALIPPDPPEVIHARRREWERALHEPSLVLELPPGHMAWCLACSKPWPCPEADNTNTHTIEGTA